MRSSAAALLLVALLAGCAMQPDGLKTIDSLDVARYAGTWYEIARLDHRFERGLEKITADYALNEDGTLRVTNRGFDVESQAWKSAEGTARFREGTPNGKLKVTFFWPFYGGYNIVELDPGYQHVLIIGPDTRYAWILARQPQLDDAIYRALVDKARAIGVPQDAWIRVQH
jgi:apolipoprotein D and lipocalin family protein